MIFLIRATYTQFLINATLTQENALHYWELIFHMEQCHLLIHVCGILHIIWRETKARLSTHATQKSKMAGLLVDVACVLSLAFVFAPNNIKNNEKSK